MGPVYLNDIKFTVIHVMACTIWQETITWINDDIDLQNHMSLPGHNELQLIFSNMHTFPYIANIRL